ncbi:unnamed protein product [Nippostrongylus brasiliensis]|uniref:ER membrane protein complex subunit 1 n=1 Tax=Nippostrongylus brasiliensis TaxID=27835 RepID=A0A0N4XUC7_NIPBR|nr:unnamed protein product [Nippostrongylus brasiliensis]
MGQSWVIYPLLVAVTNALFEDQVGKFDWYVHFLPRLQYVGCPNEVHFDTSGKEDRLLVSTRENVFASLSSNTGRIVWRRIQEDSNGVPLPSVTDDSTMFTVSDSGRVVRAWNKRNGALTWQWSIAGKADIRPSSSIALSQKSVIVSSSGKVFCFSKQGSKLWQAQAGNSQWSKVVVNGDAVLHFSIANGALQVRTFSLESGESKVSKTGTVEIPKEEMCTVVHNTVACAVGDTLFIADFTGETLREQRKSIGFSIRALTPLDNSHLLIKGFTSAVVLNLGEGDEKKLTIDHAVDAGAMAMGKFVAVVGKVVEVYDMKGMKQIFKASVPSEKSDSPPFQAVYMSVKESIELLLVGVECRLEFLIVDISKQLIVSEWVREEALARISSVEMVDLPLSELQQMIEDEFEEGGSSNIMSSFIRRLISQISQIHKWLLNTINEVFNFTFMISTRTNSFSKLLQHVRSAARSGRHGDCYDSKGDVLERDFFNLRKIIVATSLDGVVYGLDSSDGTIVWRLWLGSNFSPLTSSIGYHEVPLFVQRTTAHYQLPGRASVAFRDSTSSVGVLVFFNPITGKIVEQTQLPYPISRVDVLNVPEEVLRTAAPVYILIPNSSLISGANINLVEKRLERTWTADLHLTASERIIAVKGKPRHQKVHSQGRVLIDRNVQYKYINPNLVAMATLDSEHQYLSLFLIDEVFDSLAPTRRAPEILTQSYIYAQGIKAMAVSETEKGLTTRSLLIALPLGGIHEVTRKLLDATRPLELTQEMREEMMIPASGLESTSLMLAYGTDVFFTRLHPSGTFDILKDDFDHVLISIVLFGLIAGSVISKKLARNNALSAAWA